MIIHGIKKYPDGCEEIITLLHRFPVLKKEQIIIYLIQTNATFNRARAESLIDELIELKGLFESKGYISLTSKILPDEDLILAFWLFLKKAKADMPSDRANYPAEIIFKDEEFICEIFICNDGLEEKLDYLSKRKSKKVKCKYIFLFPEDTINDFDDSLFPNIDFVIATIKEYKEDIPLFVFHETFKRGEMNE